MSRRVELVVETLVLEGVEGSRREAVAAAFTAELARLLAPGAVPPRPGRAASPGVATVRVASRDAAALGVAFARAVHGQLPVPAAGGAAEGR